MKIITAKNLRYANKDKTAIHCDVLVNDEWLPCVIANYDTTAHIVDAFARATAGEFGEIADYEPPKLDPETLADNIRAERDFELLELDKIVSNPLRYQSFTDTQRDELAAYRQALLDVPQQEAFPYSFENPVKPDFI